MSPVPSERVWVIAYKNGRGQWSPLYGTFGTRSGAIAIYDVRHGEGAYARHKQEGRVQAMRATLTLEQPKSKRRRR